MEKKTKYIYSKEKLEKLKANVKIEEIVGESFNLIKMGKNYFTSCPFCGASKAMCISQEKQFAHCFSCNESFDVFGYFTKVKHISFKKAVIEVKRHINSKNDIELRKLMRASKCFAELKQDKNPITGTVLGDFFSQDFILEVVDKIKWVLDFLISDYYNLNEEKCLLYGEVVYCGKVVRLILEKGVEAEPLESKDKLTNLFNYILELLDLIKENDLNLSGIVYGLK